MDFKKIYRGEVIRTTSTPPFYFNRREISVFITFSAGSIDGVVNAFREITPIFNPKTISNNAFIAKVNSPVTGAIIVLNVTDEDKSNQEIACERLRATFYRLIREYSTDLGLLPDIKEDAWLDSRYLEMYKDAADNLQFELAD